MNPLFRNSTSLFSLFFLLFTLGLHGCVLPNEEEAIPTGSLVVIHQNPQLPKMDVYVDDILSMSLSYGEISTPLDLDAIDHQISFRLEGAPMDFASTEMIPFVDQQVHVIALTGTLDLPEIIDVTRPIPDAEEGEHWFAVLDLSERLEGFKVFKDREEVLLLPQEEYLSAFINLIAEDSVRFSLSDTGGASIVDMNLQASLEPQGASLLVIRPILEEDDYYTLDLISLFR